MSLIYVKSLVFLACFCSLAMGQALEPQLRETQAEANVVQYPLPESEAEPVVNKEQGPAAAYVVQKESLVDSVPVYSDIIEKYQTRGQSLRGKGAAFLWSGIAITTVGIVLSAQGFEEMECNSNSDDYYSDNQTCGNGGTYLLGTLVTTLGIGGITTGIILRSIGGSNLRRGTRYEKILDSYKTRQKQSEPLSMELYLLPVVNMLKHEAGAQITLNF